MPIIFEGEKPFELVIQTHPTTTAEGETVVVTLPVFVPGSPQQVADVRLLLSIPQAEYLASQKEAGRLLRAVCSALCGNDTFMENARALIDGRQSTGRCEASRR
jgi:hypothetical protein